MIERRADDPGDPPSRAELEARVDQARESIGQTVDQIKGTVGDTVSGVLSMTEQFQRQPVAWSLGALSAGFAMGYSLGRAHHAKNTRGKPSHLARLADDVAAELATFGGSLVSPGLSAELQTTFGVDLTAALERIAALQTRPKPKRLALAAPKRSRARPPRPKRAMTKTKKTRTRK